MQATRNKERRCAQVMVMVNDKEKEGVKVNMRKQGKVCDVTEQARKPVRKEMHPHDDTVPLSPPPRAVRLPKPVDEDLYKIPPELLRTTKRVSHLTLSFYLFIYNILLVSNPNTINICLCFLLCCCMCRRKCWVSFPSVWFLRLVFHETARLFYSETMLGWFLLLPNAKITV